MARKLVFMLSAIYLGILGFGFLFVPRQIGVGAVPEDASPELIHYLRALAGPVLGIAVLNWLVRNAKPSRALEAITLGNLVGFGCVAVVDVLGVFGDGARPIATLFLVIHLLAAIAFALVLHGSSRRGAPHRFAEASR